MLGTPLQVAATFHHLFTIYGAILEYTGAGNSTSTSRSR